ncbi:MAG: TetR/AcrR family transcriptional regulator [Bacteroidetes bacterium]|nr:TetR/AcrR family transcriptional regulator [Bacteroidota bacterium]
MIVYFRPMRYKDELKKEAIIEATVKLVNEIGFVSSSVSKIAKEANVSPATIYIYYKNKEDLLVSTYVEIKKNLSIALLKDFNPNLPIRDILQALWLNMFDYTSKRANHFKFAEQFSSSPFAGLVNKNEVEKSFEPVISILKKGIEQKIIKDVHLDILAAFIFFPIYTLSNSRLCESIKLEKETIETAFTLAWDAIKL